MCACEWAIFVEKKISICGSVVFFQQNLVAKKWRQKFTYIMHPSSALSLRKHACELASGLLCTRKIDRLKLQFHCRCKVCKRKGPSSPWKSSVPPLVIEDPNKNVAVVPLVSMEFSSEPAILARAILSSFNRTPRDVCLGAINFHCIQTWQKHWYFWA